MLIPKHTVNVSRRLCACIWLTEWIQVKGTVAEFKRLQKPAESVLIKNQTSTPRKLLLQLEFGNKSADFSFNSKGQTRSAARNGSEAGLGGRRKNGQVVKWATSTAGNKAPRMCGEALCSAVFEVYTKYHCHTMTVLAVHHFMGVTISCVPNKLLNLVSVIHPCGPAVSVIPIN